MPKPPAPAVGLRPPQPAAGLVLPPTAAKPPVAPMPTPDDDVSDIVPPPAKPKVAGTPVTALPFDPSKGKAPAGAAPSVSAPPFSVTQAPEPKSRTGVYIGIACVAALVFACIAMVLEARNEKVKAYDLQQQEALAHRVAEERLKQAEQNLKDEAERSRKELEMAIKLTKEQVAEQTRIQVLAELEQERLAKLPGTLVLATEPAGAQVIVDGGTPLTSPVKVENLNGGTHKVAISLVGFDPVELSAEIKGSKTTDAGTIKLRSVYGSAGFTSDPDGLAFSVHQAGAPTAKPVFQGKTPENVKLPYGSYTVTFSRPGCRDHSKPFTVERGGHVDLSTRYDNGNVELTSDPSGATVKREGEFLGTTPLSLKDLTPKKVQFDLTLPGYDSTPVICEIPEGDTLKLNAQLLRKDRVFKSSEAKVLPKPYEAQPPEFTSAERKAGFEVTVSFTVRTDGSVADVVVDQATDDDAGRRCKEAVERWSFHPGTAPDGRVVAVRMEKIFKLPGSTP